MNGERKYAAESQRKRVIAIQALDQKIKLANEQYGVLKRCGLEREADEHIKPEIEKMNVAREELVKQTDADRKRCARRLLMCFCGADVLTQLADDFADTLSEISLGDIENDNEFSGMMRGVAKTANDALLMIDKVNNEAVSQYYADMAEECVDAAKKAINDVVEKWCETHKGQQYF